MSESEGVGPELEQIKESGRKVTDEKIYNAVGPDTARLLDDLSEIAAYSETNPQGKELAERMKSDHGKEAFIALADKALTELDPSWDHNRTKIPAIAEAEKEGEEIRKKLEELFALDAETNKNGLKIQGSSDNTSGNSEEK